MLCTGFAGHKNESYLYRVDDMKSSGKGKIYINFKLIWNFICVM